MMKRLFMLLSLALMVVAAMALSGVAQAASPTAKCKQAAANVSPPVVGSYKFIAGSDRKADDFSTKGSTGSADVFCGFGGDDSIQSLEQGDIFIGGAGDETVYFNSGTVYGGAGDDTVVSNYATFNGDEGSDYVSSNQLGGTFNGGLDNDYVDTNYDGATFNGDEGTDQVVNNYPSGILNNVEVVGP